MSGFGQRRWQGGLVLALLASSILGPRPAQASLQQASPQVAFAGTVQGISPDTVAIGTPNGTVLVPVNEASFAVNGMPFSAPSLTAGSFVTVQVPRSLEPILTFAGLQLETDPAATSTLAVASFDQFLATPSQSDAEFLTPAPLLPDREEVALATHRNLLPPAVALPVGVAPPAPPPMVNAFAMLPVAPPANPGALGQPAPKSMPLAPALARSDDQDYQPEMPNYQNPLSNGSGGFDTEYSNAPTNTVPGGGLAGQPGEVAYSNADQQAQAPFPDPGMDPGGVPYAPENNDQYQPNAPNGYYPQSQPAYEDGVGYADYGPPPVPAYAGYGGSNFSASVGMNFGGLSVGFNTGSPYGYGYPYPPVYGYPPFAYGYPAPWFAPYYPYGFGGVAVNFGGLSIGFGTPFGWGPGYGGWNPGWAPFIPGRVGFFPGGPVGFGGFPGTPGLVGFGAPALGVAPQFAGAPLTAMGARPLGVAPTTPFTGPRGVTPALSSSSLPVPGSTTSALRSLGFSVPATGRTLGGVSGTAAPTLRTVSSPTLTTNTLAGTRTASVHGSQAYAARSFSSAYRAPASYSPTVSRVTSSSGYVAPQGTVQSYRPSTARYTATSRSSALPPAVTYMPTNAAGSALRPAGETYNPASSYRAGAAAYGSNPYQAAGSRYNPYQGASSVSNSYRAPSTAGQFQEPYNRPYVGSRIDSSQYNRSFEPQYNRGSSAASSRSFDTGELQQPHLSSSQSRFSAPPESRQPQRFTESRQSQFSQPRGQSTGSTQRGSTNPSHSSAPSREPRRR